MIFYVTFYNVVPQEIEGIFNLIRETSYQYKILFCINCQRNMALHEVSTPETEMHDVQLFKNDLGLGITVAGYVCDEENISGIFVKDICRGSVADLTGNLKVNDRIVKVNGKFVTALSNQHAIEVLRNSGPAVIISVERYLRGAKYERLQKNLGPKIQPPVQHDKEIKPLPDLRTSTKSPDHHLSIVLEKIEEKRYLERDLSSSEQTLCNNLEYNKNDDVLELTSIISEKTSDLNNKKMMPDSNLSFTNNFQEKEVKIRLVEDSTNYNEYCGQLLSTTYTSERENSSYHINKNEDDSDKHLQLTIKNDNSANSDSSCVFFSKASDDTEKDGYETCIDESLSEEICTKSNFEATDDDRCIETPTPFNTNGAKTKSLEALNTHNNNNNNNSFQSIALDDSIDPIDPTYLEPPDDYKSDNFVSTDDSLELSLYKEDNLHSLQSYSLSDFVETDEFFLVGCLDDTTVSENELSKSLIESSVPESYTVPIRTTYRCLRLKEYYNDYEDCLEEYNIFVKSPSKQPSPVVEISDYNDEPFSDENLIRDDVCVPQILQFKSSSEPQILLAFEESELCQDFETRRHSFLPNYDVRNASEDKTMTVTSKQLNFNLEKKNSRDQVFENHWGSIRSFHIHRESDESLGISIVCGKVDLHTPNTNLGTTSGIFVKSVVPNSAAGKTGQFHTGDRILEVDGIDLTEAGHEEAVNAIRTASNPISFVVQSLIPLNTIYQSAEEQNEETPNEEENQIHNKETDLNQNHIDTTNFKNEKEIESDESEEEEEGEYEEHDEGVRWKQKVVTDKGQQIDHSSAGNFKRSQEEIAADVQQEDEFGYTDDKIKKKYASLGNTIMMVQLERGQQGLGLSLAGHKDRNCMAVFVCGLNPNGAAYKMGGIQIGDEILEVNGVVLHGRCHLNASAIIKGLAGPIFKIIILRRKMAIDDIAVRPVTQFPVSLEDESLEDKFSGYPNVRIIPIQKGNHSLGIMIIEGKHAELGQGIFISDIQDGSAAEKAGLEVGEMILAVNKEPLLGADYDTAANLLKRTEGVVTLYLSNPTKKSTTPQPQVPEKVEVEEPKLPTALKPQSQPSRSPTPVPEPPVDLASNAITPGKNSTIEIVTDNHGLGLFFVGGKDTIFSNGIVVIEIFPGGSVDKDGRIQDGDVILEANGVCLKEATSEVAIQTLRQTLPKMKLVVFRPEKIEYTIIEVDLPKKPGKGLGLSIIGKKNGKGVYVSEVLNGGSADVDGRISKGDLLVSVNGQSTVNVSADEAGAILKTVSGKATLKFHRYKPIIR